MARLGCTDERAYGMLIALLLAAGSHLVVIIDDVNTEFVAHYQEGDPATQPPTPNLDALAAVGVSFRNFWATPYCASTRASFVTGLYPQASGIGATIGDSYLDPSIDTLPELFPGNGVLVGKWHMGDQWWPYDPIIAGFHGFAGSIENVRRGGQNYFNWFETITTQGNSGTAQNTEYASTVTTDRALQSFAALPDGSLVIAAYHLAHAPWHVPPAHLHTQDPQSDFEMYLAMIEAFDTLLGQLVASVDLEETTIWVFGDNGTPFKFSNRRGKSTVYETGVNCPLIVAGKAVSSGARGKWSEALTHVIDVRATILEAEGVCDPSPDAVSFLQSLKNPNVEKRECAYTEVVGENQDGSPIDRRAARDARYKIMVNHVVDEWLFFDLLADPGELHPLDDGNLTDEQQDAYDVLRPKVEEGI